MAFEDPTQHPVRVVADLTAAGAVFVSWMQWLTPPLTVLSLTLGIAWFVLQIWESKTVREWVAYRRARRSETRVARLKRRHSQLTENLMDVTRALGKQEDAGKIRQRLTVAEGDEPSQ